MRIAAFALVGTLLGAGGAAAAPLVDHAGAPIPNTEAVGRAGDPTAVPGDPIRVAAGAAQVPTRPTISQALGTPDTAAQPAATGSPNSPEEDLADALAALATAPTPVDVTAARRKALDILEGNTGAGANGCPASLATPPRAYCGIPLLNWQPATKRKTVAAGGTVTVRIVRFGQHELTDTSLLQFDDPTKPFTIEYVVSELGGADAGDLTPTPLLADSGGPVGGMHSAIVSLAQREVDLGSVQSSRFTTHLNGGLLNPQPEHTSIVTQSLMVAMPPPRYVTAILDPNLREGHEALATMLPSNPDRQAALSTVLDASAAAKISNAAPEKQIWNALITLNTADVAGTNAIGAQLRTDVMPIMRVRTLLPPGVAPPLGAAATVAIENGESYVSSTRVRLVPGGALQLGIVNVDNVARTFQPTALFNRRFAEGANPWGQFDWAAAGPAITLAARRSTVVSVTPPADAFALWVGDQNVGDQAGAVIELDRGPVIEAFKIPPPAPASAAPLHLAVDGQGHAYATLAGFDRIVRITPGSGPLAASGYEEFIIPQQNCLPPPPDAPLVACGPSDIGIDSRGIVWATLALGNAMLRFDPAKGVPGTTAGMTVYPLAACDATCRPPPPPVVPGPLSRTPLQLDLFEDAQGNTVVWFTELDADSIGVIRVAPTGALLGAADFGCGCLVTPLNPAEGLAGPVPVGGLGGIGVDTLGRVWFAEGAAGRVGRMIPNAANPTAPPQLDHFDLPAHPTVQDFDLGLGVFLTAFPHSVTIDAQGRIWVTEQAPSPTPPTGELLTKVAILDPAAAVPNTAAGITEIPVPRNDFGQIVQMADLTADSSGTVFIADEYGDQITAVRLGQGVVGRWRTVRRQSLTDQPIADVQGNLWYIEVGANLIVRIKGITTGPVGRPALAGHAVAPAAALTALQQACSRRNWIYGTKAKPKMLLLGYTPAKVRTCIGPPTKRIGRGAKQRWRYKQQIEIRFVRNRVAGFTLLDRTYRTRLGGIGVGTPAKTLAKSRPKVTFEKEAKRYRALVSLGGGKFADISYSMARDRVRRVAVDSRTHAQLVAIAKTRQRNAVVSRPPNVTSAGPSVSTATLSARSDTVAVRPAPGATYLRDTGSKALSLVSFRVAPLKYRIRFAPGRAAVRADTNRDSRVITVYLRTGDLPGFVAHDIAHEMGHAFDDRRMNAASRRAYLRARGVPNAAWWPRSRSDYAVGAGDFAEVFALCHAPSAVFRSTLAPRPDNPCALLPVAALR